MEPIIRRTVSDSEDRPKKSLKDRAKEFAQDVLEALEDLFPTPEPTLVPVPVRGRRRRY